MLLDNFLTYDQKVIISVICGGLWIYFRTSECYKMIPREHMFSIFFVCIWIYLNYYEPLFLPIGLLVLIAYSYMPVFLKKSNHKID
jgi:magnesium-transporting ATPase (P-type)